MHRTKENKHIYEINLPNLTSELVVGVFDDEKNNGVTSPPIFGERWEFF